MRNNGIYIAMAIAALLASCGSDKPDNLEPMLTTLPATDIMRNSATLHGKMSLPNKSETPNLYFEYGTSEDDMIRQAEASIANNELQAIVSDLTAGTTYYYALHGWIPNSNVSANTLSFTTLPNDKPSLASPKILSYGPTSIVVDYNLISDGGEDLQEAGCRYACDEGEPQDIQITNWEHIGKKHVLINKLKENTTYRIWEYATNRYGETLSDTITFTTSNALMLGEAGTLSQLLDKEKFSTTSLVIAGYINGDDIEYLRQMASQDSDIWEWATILTEVNMADAMIVEGGGNYGPYNRHSKTNIIGQGMFGNCIHLTNIVLPLAATTIEKDAFEGCTNLRHIEIPASVSTLLPSSGCTSLEEISVSAANTSYSSQDGVLLNADKSQLIWFPLGKSGDYTMPPTVSSIGDYAFRGCNIRKFTLPDNLSSIGQGAFMDSKVEEVSMPAKLKSLPTGTFQGCTALTTVRLGEKMELISDYVFDNCPLTDIYIDAPTPPVCSSKAFATHGIDYLQSCKLHVPKGCKPLYRNNRNWGQFIHIVE